MIEDSQLREHGGLIPIEPLTGNFSGLKLDDSHERKLGSSTGGLQTGQHPFHVHRMGKAYHELFDDPIIAKHLRQRSEFPIRRDVRQELLA